MDLGALLEARPRDGSVEILHRRIEQWIIRVEPLREVPDPDRLPAGAAAVLALRPLVDRFPDLARVVRRHSDLLVTFSPAVRRSLALGDLHLMQAGRDLLPTAVSASGKIVETARVVPGTAVGTGVAIGATGLVAWPIVLAAAVGAAAAYAEQRWLTTTFTAFRKAMERVEHRLRDDDAGVIEAADALVALLFPSVFADGALNPQLARQLAHAQFEVDRVYASRRRFVTRWKRALDDVQRPGETPWIDEIVEELDDRRTGVVDELVLFLQAMIVRARVTSITAASLARDGDGTTALQLLDRLDDEIRDDYFDLYRRVRALATNAPEAPAWWRKLDRLGATKISWLARDDAADAHALVQKLADEMHTKIGGALPPRDGDVVVVVRNDPFLYGSAVDSA